MGTDKKTALDVATTHAVTKAGHDENKLAEELRTILNKHIISAQAAVPLQNETADIKTLVLDALKEDRKQNLPDPKTQKIPKRPAVKKRLPKKKTPNYNDELPTTSKERSPSLELFASPSGFATLEPNPDKKSKALQAIEETRKSLQKDSRPVTRAFSQARDRKQKGGWICKY